MKKILFMTMVTFACFANGENAFSKKIKRRSQSKNVVLEQLKKDGENQDVSPIGIEEACILETESVCPAEDKDIYPEKPEEVPMDQSAHPEEIGKDGKNQMVTPADYEGAYYQNKSFSSEEKERLYVQRRTEEVVDNVDKTIEMFEITKKDWEDEMKKEKEKIVEDEKKFSSLKSKNLEKHVIKLDNGNTFIEYIENDVPNGFGKLIYTNGEISEGWFKDGKEDGYVGHTYSDGGRFEGQWKNGRTDGFGKRFYIDGKISEGWFKDGKEEGFAEKIIPDGTTYMGLWKEGHANGPGEVLELKQGTTYIGEWVNGVKNGPGKYTDSNRIETKGFWENGMLNSFARVTDSYGGIKEGQYKNGNQDGQFDYHKKKEMDNEQIDVSMTETYYNFCNNGVNIGVTQFSRGFYDDGGNISHVEKPGFKRRKLFSYRYDDKGVETDYNYYFYDDSGNEHRLSSVNYGKINTLSNNGVMYEINNIDGLKKTFSQILQDRAFFGKAGLESTQLAEENLGLLVNIKIPEQLDRIRFRSQLRQPEYSVQYDSVTSFLALNGICKIGRCELAEDITFEGDYMISLLRSIEQNHIMSVVINTKKIKEVMSDGKDIDKSNETFFYVYDSSRVINPNTGQCSQGASLGNLLKNSKFLNKPQQALGSCGLHSIFSGAMLAEEDDLLRKIEDGRIPSYYVWEIGSGREPGELELKHILRTQRGANDFGVATVMINPVESSGEQPFADVIFNKQTKREVMDKHEKKFGKKANFVCSAYNLLGRPGSSSREMLGVDCGDSEDESGVAKE
ncbi:hypothetical protein FACS1894152_2470 [Bacilli bacterium]|nr:hypothetical protein FACS1894152_2470 [Bacilli bacterium]